MSAFALIRPHEKDIGGFNVRRLLPSHPHKLVGPFIFFDHMGPAGFAPGQGLDVRPHPHIGLATVTYLFEGAILHRDSLGTVLEIHPGDVNWMTAGAGIAHSERSPERLRQSGTMLHGIQVWVALPKQHEQVAPSFEHHPAATLPEIALPGVRMRLIAGSAFGRTAPTTTFSGMFYLTVEMEAGARLSLPAEYPERAVYLVDGAVDVAGQSQPERHMAVLPAGQELTIEARAASRLMLLGGEPIDGDRFIWWNFVASSREQIQQAKERWRAQEFGQVPEETDWIPLPDEPKPAESFS
ncbi:MAG TPA: pirin family protein [Noviherbaspirillum sp.]|jgi:redox-sensitive bicupin YhaK (pirin superfamily)|uniref:pirin family protein n=1 Tax=Noviherbaspirillum sp. TaxID=1926288 RepID=UPI002F959015